MEVIPQYGFIAQEKIPTNRQKYLQDDAVKVEFVVVSFLSVTLVQCLNPVL